jgi:hypothetical protein
LLSISLETNKFSPASFSPRLADWLFTQGRFKPLKGPESGPLIEGFQQQLDEQWTWLLSQE